MKKINHYPFDPFEFHLKVLNSKNKGKAKDAIMSHNFAIKAAFHQYETNFINDTLHKINNIKIKVDEIDYFRKLYNYKSKPFIELKKILTTKENNRQSVLCPNCQIETVGSLDHCVPQSEFPEYTDNPLNLMPCCTTCNSKKNDIWRKNGQRIFLNLYLDNIPSKQYLFVEFDFTTPIPVIKYFIDNKNNIEKSLFEKIAEHYKRLELCKRFSESSYDVISEIQRSVKYWYSETKDINQIIDFVKFTCKEEQKIYGTNYWKAILKLECINNKEMLDFLLK